MLLLAEAVQLRTFRLSDSSFILFCSARHERKIQAIFVRAKSFVFMKRSFLLGIFLFRSHSRGIKSDIENNKCYIKNFAVSRHVTESRQPHERYVSRESEKLRKRKKNSWHALRYKKILSE
jgi:hypothetical protein